MFIQVIVYIYLGICIAMIIFNIVTGLLWRRSKRCSNKVSGAYEAEICRELERVAEGGTVNSGHLCYIERKLRRAKNLIMFDAALEHLSEQKDEGLIRKYLESLKGVFTALAEKYFRRDEIEAAYFPYIIRKYRILGLGKNPKLEGMLLTLLGHPSLYCRENAMQAIYTSGDPALVAKALQIINKSDYYYNSKLLADGLLNYTGDRAELSTVLWTIFDEFCPWMQVTIANYFRFSSGDHCEKMLALANDKTRDHELRFSCIRYLARYPYVPACADLLRYAASSEQLRWEYAAIACAALATYPGEQTTAILKKNLSHPNWYIRYNSAKSLEQLGFGYLDLVDIIDGKDRYASEILRYHFSARDLQKAKEELTV